MAAGVAASRESIARGQRFRWHGAAGIWKSDAGAGSVFHAMISEKQLYWGAGDRLMFPWERDGWCHLYSVGVEGGAAKLLTPGNFEVEHVVYSADGKEAVYSSNQDDIDRWHTGLFDIHLAFALDDEPRDPGSPRLWLFPPPRRFLPRYRNSSV